MPQRGGNTDSCFRLVDTGWDRELASALATDHTGISIMCPFIKTSVAKRLVRLPDSRPIQVITRFNLCDFAEGVSDIAALRLLLAQGAAIRGVRNLHAKLYLFRERRAVVTSANLTEAALSRNHEFGFVADEQGIVGRCSQYFNDLWARAGNDLTPSRVDGWDRAVASYLASGARQPAAAAGLGDEGADAGLPAGPTKTLLPWVADSTQAFVKFFGEGDNRAARSMAVLERGG